MHTVFAGLALGSLLIVAERDFDAARGQLGMSGSAPLAGVECASTGVDQEDDGLEDFEAVRAELGLSGSAPLVGLERYELTVRPRTARATEAAQPEAGGVSSVRAVGRRP